MRMVRRTIARKGLPGLLLCVQLASVSSAQTLIQEPAASDRPQIDIESYSIQARIDPVEGELLASAVIRFVQLDRQNYAVFDLNRRLRVRDVYLGEEELLPVRYRQFDIDSTFEVDLSDLGQFEEPVIRVEYDGLLTPEVGRREPILARIATDSAFLLYEAKWFPTNDFNNDQAMMDLAITLPSDWELVTSSSDVVPEIIGDYKLLSIGNTLASSLGTIVAGSYKTAAATNGGLVVEAVILEDTEAGKVMSNAAADMINFYTKTFGTAVSNSFRIVEIEGANWDSRSVPGMLLIPSSEVRVDFDPWVLTRYVAGQWFPLKYPIEDPDSDAWLADGMASFAGMMYFDETLAPFEAQEHVQRTLVKALSYDGDTPVSRASNHGMDTAEYRALVAFKGGFIIRMLRDVIGHEEFNATLERFATLFGNRPISTRTFFDVTSDVAGEDLTYFFDQWLNSSGVPEFKLDYTVFRLADGYKVMGQINQDLDLFRMPVELEVETDGESEFHLIWVSGPSSDFELLTVRKPRSIRIDPNKRMLRLSPDVRVQVHISRGKDLADAERYNEAIDEYQAAIDEERLSSLAFFRMGEALLELGNLQASANLFREALNGNLDPIWVEVWAYLHLGKIFDIRGDRERALTEYQKAINTGDDAYGAQEEAERYINTPFRRSGRTIG